MKRNCQSCKKQRRKGNRRPHCEARAKRKNKIIDNKGEM